MSTSEISSTHSSSSKKTSPSQFRSKPALFVYGLLVGVLVLLGIRFVAYQPEHVHYHANFAVYINGQHQTFHDPTYYEDVSACSTDPSQITDPMERAHMHDNVNDVVHVHDHAVTWGQFFTNLGWYIGDNFLKTRTTMYMEDGSSKLHIILDGQDYTDLTPIANVVIKDQDKLLVSFGDISSSTLKQEYGGIHNDALKYDTGKDPATCSSNAAPSTSDRLKHLF